MGGMRVAGSLLLLLAATSVVVGCDDSAVRIRRGLTITNDRGVKLGADVYRPPKPLIGDGPTDRAAVVLVHGGGWTGGDRSMLAGLAKSLASAGYVAVTVDYDLDGPDRFPQQVHDVQQWVRYVQQQASDLDVDPTRVGLLGASSGGNLAMMVGALGSGDGSLPRLRGVASWSGPSDLTALAPPDGLTHPGNPPPGCAGQQVCIGLNLPSAFTDYLGCTLDECPDRYRDASPVNVVSRSTPPMYLTAATEDFVPFDQCRLMAEALEGVDVEAQTAEVPGNGHAESLAPQAMQPTIEFFDRVLG